MASCGCAKQIQYAELEAPYELGTIFSEEEDRDVDNYLKKTLVFSKEGMTTMNNFPVPNIKLVEIRTEIEDADATNLDELEGFNVCGDQSDDFETGGACMWVIDQTMYDALPDDQRNGTLYCLPFNRTTSCVCILSRSMSYHTLQRNAILGSWFMSLLNHHRQCMGQICLTGRLCVLSLVFLATS